MHLLPHGFVMQAAYSSQGRLPERRRSVMLESLPHLLPRQAFLFWPGTFWVGKPTSRRVGAMPFKLRLHLRLGGYVQSTAAPNGGADN